MPKENRTRNFAVETAASMFDGYSGLAREIGVSDEAVRQWAAGIVEIPAKRCVAVERATRGRVTREVLRPDLFVRAAA